MANPLQLYMTYSFIRLLVTPWEETEAFKLGIIDAEGEPLKRSTELSSEERKSYTVWHRLVYKLKRLLNKLPFGRTLMASYISALWLIKENVKNKADFDQLLEQFCKHVGYDPKTDYELTEDLADNNILEPGQYLVIADHLDGLVRQEVLHIPESLEPVDCILGFPVYTYQGHPFTQFDVFKLEENVFVKEDANAVGNGAVAGINPGEEPPGPSRKLIRRTKFAGMEVFECNDDVYHKCMNGKPKYHRYSYYVGDDEIGQAIREYGLDARKKPIILQNAKTGHMIYLRQPG